MTAPRHSGPQGSFSGLRARVISLQRRQDRLTRFFADNGKALGGLEVEPFAAVDGTQLKGTRQTLSLFLTGHPFRAGEIGCALSHVLLWADLSRRQDQQAVLIFEDDPLLCDDFAAQLAKIWAQLRDDRTWDVCFLSTLSSKSKRQPTHVGGTGSKLEKWTSDHRAAYLGGCHTYMVSRRGAQRLLGLLDRAGLNRPIDLFVADSFRAIDLLSAVPGLSTANFLSKQDDDIDTDIQRTPRLGLIVAPPSNGFLPNNLAEVIASSSVDDAPTLIALAAKQKPSEAPPPKEWPAIDLPQSLAQARQLHRALQDRPTLSDAEARVERIFRANLDLPLPEAQRLFFLQCRLKIAHRKQFGRLSAKDQARYDALDRQLDAQREQIVKNLVPTDPV